MPAIFTAGMLYLIYVVGSFISCAATIVVVNFMDAYLAGPNYHLLDGYVTISKLLLYLVVHVYLFLLFRLQKSKRGVMVSLLMLVINWVLIFILK